MGLSVSGKWVSFKHRAVGEAFREPHPIGRPVEADAHRLEVDMALRHLEVGQELGAEADEVEAAAEQVARRAQESRVDVGDGEVATAQEPIRERAFCVPCTWLIPRRDRVGGAGPR